MKTARFILLGAMALTAVAICVTLAGCDETKPPTPTPATGTPVAVAPGAHVEWPALAETSVPAGGHVLLAICQQGCGWCARAAAALNDPLLAQWARERGVVLASAAPRDVTAARVIQGTGLTAMPILVLLRRGTAEAWDSGGWTRLRALSWRPATPTVQGVVDAIAPGLPAL